MKMSETLRYGIDTGGRGGKLYVEIPLALSVQISEEDSRLTEQIQTLSSNRNRLVDIDTSESHSRLSFYTNRLGRIGVEAWRSKATRQIVDSLSRINDYAYTAEVADPTLDLVMQATPTSRNRYRIGGTVRWPQKSSEEIENVVTQYMQDMARQLRYKPQQFNSMVYASVHRDTTGVVLQTNPSSGCSTGTNSEVYHAEDEKFDMYSRNVLNNTQQLILLTGLVALARADELEAPHPL